MKQPLPDYFSFLDNLDAINRHEIEGRSKNLGHVEPQVIISQDETGDGVYIIEKGVVEVVSQSPDGKHDRVLAYLCRGDFFGELSVLTGETRSASIRACEDVHLIKIPTPDFLHLIKRVPGLGYYFSAHLAARLYRLTRETATRSHCTDFGGNLPNFDVLLIFQTIASSGQAGELRLLDDADNVFGSFYFQGPTISHGRFAHLNGVEAMWQVFLETALPGSFSFQITGTPSIAYDDSCQIGGDGMDLLMQAASKRDYFQALPQEWRDLSGRLGRHTETLRWEDAEHGQLALQVWDFIANRPQVLNSVWRRLNVCTFHLASVAKRLVETGQATYEVDEIT
ncbi:MAG: cyclic nucleotide-binding domain-containing protein [Verrucomicrobiota bacterium]